MGSSISAIYDDYDDYKHFCKSIGVEPVGIFNHFYDNQRELLRERGFNRLHQYWEAIALQKRREDKINSIINN